MMHVVATAYYRATIPVSAGRVRSVDSALTFQTQTCRQQSPIERQNTLRLLARQRIAESHGISPLLVHVRDLHADVISDEEARI